MKSKDVIFNRLIKIYISLIALAIMLFVSGCSTDRGIDGESSGRDENLATKEEPDEGTFFPALMINGGNRNYQPIYAVKTKMDQEMLEVDQLYYTSLGIPFVIDDMETDTATVRISNTHGQMMEEKTVTFEHQKSGKMHFLLEPDASVGYVNNQSYFLEVEIDQFGNQGYYYATLLYGEKDGNQQAANLAYQRAEDFLKNENSSFMGEPRIWINGENEEMAIAEVAYTSAVRVDDGFVYQDVFERYEVNLSQNQIQLMGRYTNDKQRYYYSSESGGWFLGNEELNASDNKMEDIRAIKTRKIKNSSNSEYDLIYNEEEMYLYNYSKQEMQTIYRIDAFNGDYIYDEYSNHLFRVLELTDDGTVYFAVLGYMNDKGPYDQKNGIEFFKYKDNQLTSLGFIEKPFNKNGLDHYFENMSYYNSKEKILYFIKDSILYALDMNSGEFDVVQAFLDGEFYMNQGIIVWEGSDSKYNGSIYCVDLSGEQLMTYNLYETGVYKRLLGVTDHYLVIGEYLIEDTYEFLNKSVIYPCQLLKVYNFSGDLIETKKADTYGDNYFYSELYLDHETLEWKVDLIQRDMTIGKNAEKSRIRFIDTKLTEAIESIQSEKERVTYLTEDYPGNNIPAAVKDEQVKFAMIPEQDESETKYITFSKAPKADVYKIVEVGGTITYTTTLNRAFRLSENKQDYQILFSKYDEQTGEREENVVFNSANLIERQYLDSVHVIPQRPELPRGCEVTALAVLLDYYLDQAPDKMELANKLRVSEITPSIKNGFVSFANMNVEFAGSMSDTAQSGLGVYIPPIRDLASEYVHEKAIDVTGLSFEQMLTFVGNEQPVLIIIPNRYQDVADYGKEVWNTPDGYMEVTYQEHSVVIMGYDDDYVYYSDPSKGKIDKKTKNSFKEAWESMGSQAMVIFQ